MTCSSLNTISGNTNPDQTIFDPAQHSCAGFFLFKPVGYNIVTIGTLYNLKDLGYEKIHRTPNHFNF